MWVASMMEFGGWQFPDGERHLPIEMMKKNGVVASGRLSYQYPKIELALSHVRSWRRAVDIGAHVGLWAFHLAPRFERVDCFEPVPLHQELFALNMVHADNVTLHPCALGPTAGVAKMTIYADNSGAAHIGKSRVGKPRYEHIVKDREIEVLVATLDSLGFQDVDFIKIDTEGFELQVLQGAVETLRRCHPVMVVEQKPIAGSCYGYDDRAALPFLYGLGARVVAERARDYVLIWPGR
jgi:FkbM family methyltransferase